ncbi:MAG: hypothetical protein A3F04_00925 [Candidatus Chisholmbacteria bacterium RIFCSPHIGHO2_12_FULL_49_9]|uniref:Uncharacterized protein n=1 Tax=Candidatus Chisholmbacteria bacterium RIFCSPHIGHO2_01_FULL_52_32 TaxID=1797591 RepID=A0A1G1VTJ5_9BACT|nr:MAG: hypothetical protein A2786_04250 [Candidatus Chisholmbacteria bacterium RIFCSPHIGHO2_01_FULL_52_32]OGY19950.1 MAG: hypothetical protein A2900_02495 [Candidatus Chisholmbacteria bacterium RIFCSPLOWO2_01_FULL_50_28]OGY20809.1 MAG: hypothetical protein A3F04_00925 [Candidatus Chisholmbacteria bacterium RIFCSPHIGHO2_12_FULL_49_9]
MRVEEFREKLGTSYDDSYISPEDASRLVRSLLLDWGYYHSEDEKWQDFPSQDLIHRQRQHGIHTIRALIAISEGTEPRSFWEMVRTIRQSEVSTAQGDETAAPLLK